MVMSRFPFGIQTPFVVGGGVGLGNPYYTTGSMFFLHNATGHDTNNSGLDPQHPLKTLDAALGKCTDSKMDIIVGMPGHAETITGIGGITFDKIGVRFIGLGGPTTKPTFLMDAAASVTCAVTAADTYVENIKFLAGFADIVKFASVSAKGNRWVNCDIGEFVPTENFKIAFSVGSADNDADDFAVIGCQFIMPDAANTQVIEFNKNQNRPYVVGNYIAGDFAASGGPIHAPATEVITDAVIVGNFISNAAADTIFAINLAGTNIRGIIANNRSGDGDIDGTPYIGPGMALAENYHSGVLGTASGFLYPVADS